MIKDLESLEWNDSLMQIDSSQTLGYALVSTMFKTENSNLYGRGRGATMMIQRWMTYSPYSWQAHCLVGSTRASFPLGPLGLVQLSQTRPEKR